jgi:hypothetical protein
MMDQPAALNRTPRVHRLLQRIQHKPGMGRGRHAPADDAPREGVDDEGHVGETLPGRDISEVRHPQAVRPGCLELPLHAIERTGGGTVGDGGPHVAATHHAA